MTELFKTAETKKEEAAKPQEIEFKSTKGSQIKVIYKPIVIGGIAKSPVLIASLKQFIDDFEKETIKEVKKDEEPAKIS